MAEVGRRRECAAQRDRGGVSHRRGRLGRRPVFETLESRSLLAMTFQFADSVSVSGAGMVDIESNAVTNDVAGNVYVTGSLQGTADFDPGAGVTNLTSTGSRDIFLAEYSKTGALVWAKNLRGLNGQSVGQGSAIAVDGSGDVFITGTFTGTINFDPGAGNSSFSAPSRNDAFIAEYGPDGTLVWARDMTGSTGAYDSGYSVAVDPSGNVAVAGSMQGNANLGTFPLAASGTIESFVAELNASGQFLWATATIGTTGSVAQSSAVCFDGLGHVVATGFFSARVNFDPKSSGLTFSSAGLRDIFVQELDGNGNTLWVRAYGGNDTDQANAVASDSSGNVYISGSFSTSVNFDPGATNTSLNAGGYEDAFLLKVSGLGQFSWVRDLAARTSGDARATGVALDGAGHAFVAGYFLGNLALDPATAGATLTSSGSYDVFLGEYTVSGSFVSGLSMGGAGFDTGTGIGVNSTGQVAITGRYTGPAAFGPFTLHASTNQSIFISELATSTPPQLPSPPSAPGAPVLEAGSDTGLSQSDGITNALSLLLDVANVAAPGNTVELLRDGVVVAQRTGSGALTDRGPIADGTHVYTARQTDTVTGLVSTVSAGTSVTLRTQLPKAPAAPLLLPVDDSGVKGDGITNVRQPRLTGAGDPLTLIQLIDGSGQVINTIMTAADGTFAIKLPAPLADGPNFLRFREEDVAGNFSPRSSSLALSILSTTPASPTVPKLVSKDDSGTLGDGITSMTQPHLSGMSTAGMLILLIDSSGNTLGTSTAAVDGSYSVAPSVGLADGSHALRTEAVDAAANVSLPSPPMVLTILTTPPLAPSVPALASTDASAPTTTLLSQPHLIGTSKSGLTLELLDPNGLILGTGVVNADGTYSVQIANSLANGTYSIRAEAIDVAGNKSPASAPFAMTIAVPVPLPATPSAPVLDVADDSGIKGDGITNVTQPYFLGSGPLGTMIQLVDGSGKVIGSATVAGDGTYRVAPLAPLMDGSYSLQARAADGSGNSSLPSSPLAIGIDTLPPPSPTTPVLLSKDDSGVKGDDITSVNQPRLAGSAGSGLTIQLEDGSGRVLGTSIATSLGAYSLFPSTKLTDGTYSFRIRAIDAAGNSSPPSGFITIIIDSTPPGAPAGPSLSAADDSGTQGDGITNVSSPRLVGSASSGSTIQLLNAADGLVIGSAVVASDGTYDVQPTTGFSDGTFSLQTRDIDAAGNVGTAGPILRLTILTTPPSAPDAPAIGAGDDTGILGDGRTALRRPHLVGQGIAGDFVDLLDSSGAVIASGNVSASGAISLQPSTNFGYGATALRFRFRDVAGNLGAASAVFNLKIVDASLGDFDGDGKTDLTVFNSSQALWITQFSGGGSSTLSFGESNLKDIPIPADFDGLGRSQRALYRPATAQWLIQESSGLRIVQFGDPSQGDIPVPGDYDGTGHAEFAVFRPSTDQWLIAGPSGLRIVQFGDSRQSDLPIPGDYDGLGHTELALFRESTAQWLIAGPNGLRIVQFGDPSQSDLPVPGDYDGLGHTQLALFRPGTAQWLIAGASGLEILAFGNRNLKDVPTQAPLTSLLKLGVIGGVSVKSLHASSAVQTPSGHSAFSISANRIRPAQAKAVLAAALKSPGNLKPG